MNQDMFLSIPNLDAEELAFIREAIKELNEEQKRNFFMLYQGKRKDPQMIMLLILIGFIGVAGVHRIILGQIGMGIVYLLTAGLCFIGTIVDLVNYKKLALEFNQRMIVESKMMSQGI